jgi:hypothetical protein
MSLAFQSISHGEIAFGFFNIETDMLLLDVHFFFADDFCAAIDDLALREEENAVSVSLDAYTLEPSRIGNLMGSIHGIDFRGFIGEVYKLYPFPKEAEKFRQQPEGSRNRSIIEETIHTYARMQPINISADPVRSTVDIGGYLFSVRVFHELIQYVWEGGYPKWRDAARPSYVLEMREAIGRSANPLFKGIRPFQVPN